MPDHCRVLVDDGLDDALAAACAKVPPHPDEELYEPAVQAEMRQTVRAAAPVAFDRLIERLQRPLRDPPFCVITRGLSCHLDDRLFIAVNRSLGSLVAPPLRKPRGQLVHRIQPATDIRAASGAHRESERLHTDCADWAEPAQLLAMACVRPDPSGGGDSLLLDRVALVEEVATRLGERAVRTLERTAVPWQLAAYQGGGVSWQPILAGERLRWRRYTIDAALAREEVEIDSAMRTLLDELEQLIESTERTIRFRLEPGELLIMDNHRAIHSRMALGDSPRATERLMLRSWIQPDRAARAVAPAIP